MPRSFTRPAAALSLAGLMAITLLGGWAQGTSQLDLARHHRAALTKTILRIRRDQRNDTSALRARVEGTTRLLVNGIGKMQGEDDGRWRATRPLLLRERHQALSKMRTSERRSLQRSRVLMHRRKVVAAWIEEWGILQTCPVRGSVVISDDFGVLVSQPGVPVHVHEGNDMMAATGTPIVAPFAGTATAVPNGLGGLAVKVTGDRGYVYNAHLSAYGQLGKVRTGTVIGYVGSTGDAGGPHDHFEWHPGGGPAVDPNPYLIISCG
jgi:murein DD-endopeptidase MepM/ murein hydrolase activator NlpD